MDHCDGKLIFDINSLSKNSNLPLYQDHNLMSLDDFSPYKQKVNSLYPKNYGVMGNLNPLLIQINSP